MKGFDCVDCGVDTSFDGVNEYYSVLDTIWDTYGAGRGMLCIGCLESRIGRTLRPMHFSSAPINAIAILHGSDRIKERITGCTTRTA